MVLFLFNQHIQGCFNLTTKKTNILHFVFTLLMRFHFNFKWLITANQNIEMIDTPKTRSVSDILALRIFINRTSSIIMLNSIILVAESLGSAKKCMMTIKILQTLIYPL